MIVSPAGAGLPPKVRVPLNVTPPSLPPVAVTVRADVSGPTVTVRLLEMMGAPLSFTRLTV